MPTRLAVFGGQRRCPSVREAERKFTDGQAAGLM
jgi:hypothetical protein